MKRILVIVAVLCLFILTALFLRMYESRKVAHFDEMEMRTIAWNSLNESEKNSVLYADKGFSESEQIGDADPEVWKKSKINIVKWKDIPMLFPSMKQSIVKKIWLWYKSSYKAVRIEFTTSMNGLLGPIVIYIDPDSKKIIGHDLRF